jgi:hypothetical protein
MLMLGRHNRKYALYTLTRIYPDGGELIVTINNFAAIMQGVRICASINKKLGGWRYRIDPCTEHQQSRRVQ